MVILITQVAAGLVIYFQKETVSVSYCVCCPWTWLGGAGDTFLPNWAILLADITGFFFPLPQLSSFAVQFAVSVPASLSHATFSRIMELCLVCWLYFWVVRTVKINSWKAFDSTSSWSCCNLLFGHVVAVITPILPSLVPWGLTSLSNCFSDWPPLMCHLVLSFQPFCLCR